MGRVEEIIKEHQAYAEKKGFRLNPDKKVVEMLVKGMLENIKKSGQRHCPCRRLTGIAKEDEKIICPCQFHLEELDKEGQCLCGLFVKG